VLVTRWVGPPQRFGSSTILIWFDFKREAIATRGRSYGEVFVGACWSREGGPPRWVGSSTILIWFDFKRGAIATRGRSYGEVFVGACWSREGGWGAVYGLLFTVY